MKPLHSNIPLLTWFNFCLDFRLYSAIAILYFTKTTGSFALALSIFSITTISAAICELPTGIWSDRVGRKKTLIAGQICSILAVTGYAIGGSFWLLALGAILEGISRSLFSGNNEALLYDSLKENSREEEYPRYLGSTSSMFQFALAISASFSIFILGWWTFSVLLWLSVIPQVIGLLLALRLQEPQKHYAAVPTNVFHHLREAVAQFRKNAKLRTLSLANAWENSIGEVIHQFSPAFFATLWPVWAMGIARVGAHICAATGMRLSDRLMKKFEALKVLIGGHLFNFLIGIGITLFPTVVTPLLNALNSFTFGTNLVAKNTLLQREFTDQQRATMGSLNSLAASLMFGIFAVLFGLWADMVGPQRTVLTGFMLLLLAPYLYWHLFRKK